MMPVKYPLKTVLPVNEKIVLLRKYIQEEKLSLAADMLCALLGFGKGLTPSGDDFAIGTLICLNRWKNIFLSDKANLESFNQLLVKTAVKSSTG